MRRLLHAGYYAFLIAIPIETIVYFQDAAQDPGSSVSLSRLVGVILVALAFVQWRVCFRRWPATFWMIAWYLAAFTLSWLWIPPESLSKFHEELMTLVQMTALFLISVNVLEDEEFRARAFRVFGWWVAIVALGVIFGVFGMDLGSEDRTSIVTQDPNITAGLFTFAALCIAGDPKLVAGRRRFGLAAASAAAIAVLAVGILRTGSRGGLLAFGTGMAALALCGGRRTRVARVAIAVAVLGASGALIAREFARGSGTAARIERAWDNDDTAGRTEIYDAAWTMVRERPLTGYGGANNRFVLGAHLNYPDRDTHNTFLSVLTEVGFVGGVPFFLALLWALWRSWRHSTRTGDALIFALLVSLLVLNSSITGCREKIFWIILAAAATV